MGSFELAPPVSEIPRSTTLLLNARVKEMQAAGLDVVNLTAGEPDFPTPERIRAAAIRAINMGMTRYTPVPGILPLRKAVAKRIERDYGLGVEPENVIVSNGGKQSLYNLWRTILNPGDEVVVISPHWVSYPHQIHLANAHPIVVEARSTDDFQIDVSRLATTCGARTRAVLINSPSNPTGVAYREDVLSAIATLCCERDLLLVTDDLYYQMLFHGFAFRSPVSLVPEVAERTVIIGGVSKAFSMTGWRIGYAAGPGEIIDGMARLQAHSTSNPCSISQYAALEALSGDEGDREVAAMVAELAGRCDRMYALITALPDVDCVKPQGTFYLFPRVSQYYGKRTPQGILIGGSDDFVEYLIESVRLAGVPGSAFGNDDHVRFSFACNRDVIEEGMKRLARALEGLTGS